LTGIDSMIDYIFACRVMVNIRNQILKFINGERNYEYAMAV